MKYVPSIFSFKRRVVGKVQIGNISIGADNPICIQSMANTNTNDIDASVVQCVELIEAGCEMLRFTTQGKKEVESLRKIQAELRSRGYDIPLVADVHFNPAVADEVATFVEKVRINPGNYVDGIHTFKHLEYTDEEYAQELNKIRLRFLPFLEICRAHNTAVRIGVNHGSLSDRIMSRYGDTPYGMVESCMEFLRLCHEVNFSDVVVSIKASNTRVMMQTVRLMAATMQKEGLQYALHLGVTEAGNGNEGRMKSSVGIGGLLIDGIGDTFRVSLTEDPLEEIPVAKKILKLITDSLVEDNFLELEVSPKFTPFEYQRRTTTAVGQVGGSNAPITILKVDDLDKFSFDFEPDFVYVPKKRINHTSVSAILDADCWEGNSNTFPFYKSIDDFSKEKRISQISFVQMSFEELDAEILQLLSKNPQIVLMHQVKNIGVSRAFFHTLLNNDCKNPVVISYEKNESDFETFQLECGMYLGHFFIDGFGDGIFLQNSYCDAAQIVDTELSLLQATRVRMTRTEYVACPSCGRTLFDLQTTLEKVKQATSHLKNLKIAVMGCIVNGTGEMADADYGYVGAGKGKISLYKEKTCIEKNIPESEAIEHLVDLIKSNGDWVDKKD
ncbi:MAG: (E)-4-hydroxy-3-methylbut-2-enyl-diphosphate synthase [Paludibacteraceae bacterium]|nr:(E)-4-hydroxy-3-methylbut-2-enyl-diphosphate synthase [Paludibacteraceae bacterium]